jgi:hypothetical protein
MLVAGNQEAITWRGVVGLARADRGDRFLVDQRAGDAGRQRQLRAAHHEAVDVRPGAVDVLPPVLQFLEALGGADDALAEDVAHVDVHQRAVVVVIPRHRLTVGEVVGELVGVLDQVLAVEEAADPLVGVEQAAVAVGPRIGAQI